MRRAIVLYNPRPSRTCRPGVPLSLLALARMFPSPGDEVAIVNATTDRDAERRVLDAAPGALLLGISAMTGHQIRDGLALARKVRRAAPRLPIVWGGYHPSLLPQETASEPLVDYAVCGQGERPFFRLVQELKKGGSGPIPGVWSGPGSGLPPEPPEDLDRFPFLAWDRLSPSDFPADPEGGAAVDFYTSQGCPFRCTFCAEPAMHGRRRVGMSPLRAVDELEYLQHRGVTAAHLRDTLFFADHRWVSSFCEEALRRDLSLRFYGANGRVDTLLRMSEDGWKLLERAGFREVLLGIESGHRPALEKIEKRFEPEDCLELLDRASSTHIRFFLTALVGLPGVAPDDEFRDTVRLLHHILRRHRRQVSSVYLFNYAPYPGSRLYEEAQRAGFRPPTSMDGWGRIDLHGRRYPWGSSRARRRAWILTRYLLPRILAREPSRIPWVESVYHRLDPRLERRWDKEQFDRFWEGGVFAGFDAARWLRSRLSRPSGRPRP